MTVITLCDKLGIDSKRVMITLIMILITIIVTKIIIIIIVLIMIVISIIMSNGSGNEYSTARG